jgi:hypothetical protein
MARDWEATFSRWAQPPGPTESDHAERAVRAVRAALDADDALRPLTRVYVHGSFRNRVNIPADSGLDLGVLYTGDVFFRDYPTGRTDADFGNAPGRYTYAQFKDDVDSALRKRFGSTLERGDKGLGVHDASSCVDATVVPTFVHRRYYADGSYVCGVEFQADSGARLINWPERLMDDPHWPQQHFENGTRKNADTGRRYRGVVRILKSVRNEMAEAGCESAREVTGFFVECLTWNVPNPRFNAPTWDERVQRALGYLWTHLKPGTEEDCNEWGEVSELKYLFKNDPVKKARAYRFLDEAWSYIGVR